MKSLQMSFCILGILALSACANTAAGMRGELGDPNDPSRPPTDTQMWEGMKADWQDLTNWAHNKPSTMEKRVGQAPTGYAKREPMVNLKAPPSMRSETGLVWKPVGQPQEMVVSGSTEILKPEGVVSVKKPNSWKDIGPIEARNMPQQDDQGPPLMLRQEQAMEVSLMEPPAEDNSDGGIEYSRDVTIYPVDGDSSPYERNFAPVSPTPRMRLSESAMTQQVFFGYGSDMVEAADRKALKKLGADLLKTAGDYHVNVVGHASKRVDNVNDPVKKKEINAEMAEKRASAVTKELNKAGLPADRVTSLSRGDTVPNPHPGNKPQEAADRRVEIYVNK